MPVPGPPDYPKWLHEFERKLSRYALPFAFGPRLLTSTADLRNGTCFAIVIEETAPFLLTADHVLDTALRYLARGHCDCVIGPLEPPLSDRIISRDKPLDVATIRLTQAEVQILERNDLLIVRPEEWPPRPPAARDLIVFVGFPASARVIHSWTDGLFNGLTSQAQITGIRHDGFRYRAELKDLRQYDVATGKEEDVLTDYGGISGGPVFRVKPRANPPARAGRARFGRDSGI